MRTKSNSLGLLAFTAAVGIAVTTPFAGCGGDSVSIKKSPPGTGGAGGEGGGEGGAGGGMVVCGDGIVGGNEACDDANLTTGDGCEPDCSFTCNNTSPATGDAKCDDQDPCNGTEKCLDTHICQPGMKAPEGTACGMAQICIAGICSHDLCGDAFVSANEECDDANITNGDGCDTNCKKTACGNGIVTTGEFCDDGNATNGDGCDGNCTPTACGNNIVSPGEACDDGNLNDGDGCDADCTISCVDPQTDCPAAPVCQSAACPNGVCTTNNVGTDMACAAPSSCQNGACVALGAICGNGFTEMGEDCDFGAQNGPKSGCETNCKFSCATDATCNDMNTCNGAEICTDVTVNGKPGKKCSAGMNQAKCSACTGGVCNGGACTTSTCGDGCVDSTAGEQCEPPNTVTCSNTCKNIVGAVCGNGVREVGEQCDDGNKINMDACDASCKFEQVHRVNWLDMQFNTDAYCTANRLGSAIASQGQPTISDSLATGVNDGSISILFKMLNLDDLSGTTDPMIEVGVLNGLPVLPLGVAYSGALDLEWWYTVDMLSLDASRMPVDKLAGSITAKVLNAGPGPMTLNMTLGGSPASLKMSNAKITASIGVLSKPLTSTNGTTPGHLASENLDATLQSYQSTGQPNPTGAGKLCGNVRAASLQAVPVPVTLLSGTNACNQGYSTANNLLDVIIGGCTVTFLNIQVPVINVRQPDEQDPSFPDLGAGYPYTLTRSNVTKAVNGCRDKNNQNVPLNECLQDAAYSAFFKFATGRVIGK